jgi:hypothetical protein
VSGRSLAGRTEDSPSTYRMLGPSVLFTYAVRLVLAAGRVAGGDDAYTAVFACTKKAPL